LIFEELHQKYHLIKCHVCVSVFAVLIFFREVLGSFFDEIYFMPDVPSLACINTELRKHSYTSKRYLVP